MKCEEVQSLLIEYQDDQVDEILAQEIEEHFRTCEACRAGLEEIKTLFGVMSKYTMEQPDESLRRNFNEMLQSEIEKLKLANHINETPIHRIIQFKGSSPAWRIAAAVLLLVTGVGIGILMRSGNARNRTSEIADLKNEMKDMKEMLMFTMLNGESASQRIKAVNYSTEIAYPNQKVIAALVSTLNNDKNVNVRLAAAYSLEKFWDISQVRDSLISSLARQNEPIIQIVLINMLTNKKETKAIVPMQEIIANKNTMKQVKDIAEKSIQVLM